MSCPHFPRTDARYDATAASMAVTVPARDVADAEARLERHVELRMKIDAQMAVVQVRLSILADSADAGRNWCVHCGRAAAAR